MREWCQNLLNLLISRMYIISGGLFSLWNNNVKIFWKRGNRLATATLCTCMITIIAFATVVFGRSCTNWIQCSNDVLTVSGVLLTILGIFVSVRVLMAVDGNRTIEIEDWLKLTTDIVEEAMEGYIVYIIAPTFCVGLSDTNKAYLLTNLCELIQYKKKKKVKFILACLKANFQDNPSIEFHNDVSDFDYLNNSIKNDPHWNEVHKKVCAADYNMQKDQVAKFSFVIDIYYKKLRTSYESIVSAVGSESIKYLSPKYINADANIDHAFSGFFVSARIEENSTSEFGRGKYYLGTFNHNGKKTTFNGTAFCNDHIGKEMNTFINQVLDANAPDSL